MDLSRRATAILGVAALAIGAVTLLPTHTAAAASPGTAGSSGWVASWAASPMAPTALISAQAEAGFTDQTVRNIVYTSVGGDAFRVRVSNAFGASPLTVGAVSVGLVLTGAQLAPDTSHAVTFDGKTSTSVPAGAEVLSDPVPMTVPPLTELAISLYLPTSTGPATYHQDAQQTGYVASGDHAADPAATAFTTTTSSWDFVDGLVTHAPRTPGTVVAFGDSITDGYQSQAGANARWPNYLARRLQAAFGGRAPAVVDEGISGNRILSPSACFGVSAETRFARDALSQPGVKDVILLEGINDIGQLRTTGPLRAPHAVVSAAQIIAGDKQIIREAHAAGLEIIGATLTPFGGSQRWTAAGEITREQVNNWILTSGSFAGVIDFARAVADPGDPEALDPAYDSGDHLHPDGAGYQAMADAISMAMLRGLERRVR